MHYQDIFAAVAVIVAGGALLAWLVFQAGRLNGYRAGIEDGKGRAQKMQHLRGMTEGYAMAMRHTPEQRDEYLRNVLLKTGAVSESDIEADRQRRRARDAAYAELAGRR